MLDGNKIIYVIICLIGIAVLSCIKEETGTGSEAPDGKVRLTLVTGGSEYGVPLSRADETSIGAPMVLVYKGEDEFAEFSEAVQSIDNGTTTTVTVNQSEDKSIFVVIANAPVVFYDGTDGTEYNFTEAALNSLLGGTFLYELENRVRTVPLDQPQATLPYSGSARLPMSGLSDPVQQIDETTVIQNGGMGKMTLTRAVAKATVQIDPSLTNFSFVGAGVVGVNGDGALYRPDRVDGHLNDQTIPLAQGQTDYLTTYGDDVLSGAGSATEPFYLYETSRLEDDAPAIILKASWNGQPYYYKLGFVIDGEVINILRNRNYTFIVSSAEPGYLTLSEAWDSPVSNIEYAIVVTDATGHDIVGNGQYYLALSNTEVINYGNRTSFTDAFVISTDYDPGWGADAVTLTPSTGITITSPTSGKIALLSSGITSAGVDFTVDPDTYTGTIEVRIGNLTQTVTYRRLATVYYSGHRDLPYKDYVRCDIPAGTADWLKLKGADNMRFTGGKTFRTAQQLSIDADRYITEEGVRETIFYASRQAGGRSKIYVTQQGIDAKTITHVAEEGFYVGAF